MTLEEARNRVKELDSGSGFYSSDYEAGWEDALCRATEILNEVEPVGNPDILTLTELARELRKVFKFRYLTASFKTRWLEDCIGLDIFNNKPWFSSKDRCWVDTEFFTRGMLVIPDNLLACSLDLSEYADENGNIDYSKCIVEVSDDIE